jgi:uncharacterized protein YcfL
MLDNKRLEELQAMYRQFILDRLGVDVNKQLDNPNKLI